jgi:DNA transposition AAA+ family ATPase
MRPVFVKTSNVLTTIAALGRLCQRQSDVPGMALIYGDPGLGKTKTALWWRAHNDGVYIRVKKLTTGRWLLEEIAAELGEAPLWRTSDLFRQCIDQLMGKPRTIILDEIDYVSDARVIETVRDLHDITNSSFVFIGMNHADKKFLARYKHLYDRFSEIIKFHDLTEQDVRSIAETMCEVELSGDAISHIYSISNRFRRIIIEMYKAEGIARTNNLREVTAAHLKDRLK